ncbi:AAA family ATPase [Vibrio coralliilyticus]|uniref:AAA family ATPase n=1 Tax=Vibrio coralliilyticus TaxID=190893 RepID=UPI00148B6C29|nr:AAA family ATPase [Vibrio coralliilyticus]NOI20839.1 AAA family ATPase [Vibrio coralliilyticus]
MIDSFYAKNYKSFPELHINIDNINVLLGANSCGKSSILNLILMLSQTADSNSTYESILRLNGDKSSMGESINIFPDKDPSKTVTFGWSTDKNKTSSPFRKLTVSNIYSQVEDYIRTVYRHARRAYPQNNKHLIELRDCLEDSSAFFFDVFVSNDESQMEITEFEYLKSRLGKYLRICNKNVTKLRMSKLKADQISPDNQYKHIERLNKISISKINDLINHAYEYRDKLLRPTNIEYEIKYNQRLNECEFKRLSIRSEDGLEIITVAITDSKKIELHTEISCNKRLNKSRLDIVRDMNLSNLSLYEDAEFTINDTNPFANFNRQMIFNVSRYFLSKLSDTNINHISPLRAFPQRYYLLEKSAQHNVLNSTDGSQLAEILKNNPKILKKVNSYFKVFGINISTAKTNDIIHRITVKQDNVIVELTDVGFGISQVLPILVQALLSPDNTLTIIEQPEIHLHPKMQAWLTTVLTEISVSENKKFLIETHSDTIIKRLQILMLDPESSLNRSNVNMFHLERTKPGRTSLYHVPLNEFGDISWPKDFLETEINDAIELQRLKVQAIKNSRDA